MASLRQWIQSATIALDQLTRALFVRFVDVDVSKDAALTGAQTDTSVWAPTAGKQICLSSLTFTVDADCTVTIHRGTNVTGKRLINQKFKAGSGVSLPYIPMFRCAVDEPLKVTTDAGNINITLTGIEDVA
jgi:hypothetical protein